MPSKLNREQVEAIRQQYSNTGPGGGSYSTLAARFSVSVSTIDNVLRGKHPLARDLPNIAGTRGNTLMRRRFPTPRERIA